MQSLLNLYKSWRGTFPTRQVTLKKSGSNRIYVRLYDDGGKSVIGVIGPSVDENKCFVYLANHFREKHLPMPEILAVSDDCRCYLQQDLGTLALYDALRPSRENNYAYTDADYALLAKTIRLLAHVQVTGSEGLDFWQCLQPNTFDRRAAMFDLNYFKYSFFKTTDLPFDEIRLEDDLERFAADLAGDSREEHFFLYRDFQARNVMLVENEHTGGTFAPYFIDFQGGMRGPLQYDVASFLWQASACYAPDFRHRLIGEYTEELRTLLPDFDEEKFRHRLELFVLFRLLQVLGAYGLRGYVERKAYFLNSIPLAINNLRNMLGRGCAHPYPYLEEVLKRMCSLPQFAVPTHPEGTTAENDAHPHQPLKVRVFSFSYKKGIPADESGNGGGYVFDCRGTNNPGRYERYKKLTGLDTEVIDFLEDDGEILTFLQSVYALADRHVARYMERGFTNLMFSFGCTGGQHRSVYSAQHLAERLHKKYNIEVHICHREQGITQVLLPR